MIWVVHVIYYLSKAGSDVVHGKVCNMTEKSDCIKVEDRYIDV